MSARRKAALIAAACTAAPFALVPLAAAPAAAHGSMGDPVSRVAQCYAEGPESPRSAACQAAVAAGGTQALYDWNGVRIGDAGGRHRQLIPDGKLCSANNAEFKGLDLARADWPATRVSAGSYTFKYRVTAPHKGGFTVYITKPGYDPTRPLKWSDLDLANPVASATDPAAVGGFYTFSGSLPQRSGTHVLYAIWQRSDSPEAFYSCSDVTFGGSGGASGGSGGSGGNGGSGGSGGSGGAVPAPSASAPSEEQIEQGRDKSTIEHGGHGDQDPSTSAKPAGAAASSAPSPAGGGSAEAASPSAQESAAQAAAVGESLARTGGDGSTAYLAMGGAAVLAAGSVLLFAVARRRGATVSGGRHSR